MSEKLKALFLDRDGTLIENVPYLNDPDKILFLPKAEEVLKKAKEAGYHLILITNQSGIARGSVKIKNMYEIHKRIQQHLNGLGCSLSDILYCPHHPDEDCSCRKPKPGMILDAAKKWNIEVSESYMIGDSQSDLEAGKNAGCKESLLIGEPDGLNWQEIAARLNLS